MRFDLGTERDAKSIGRGLARRVARNGETLPDAAFPIRQRGPNKEFRRQKTESRQTELRV